MINTVTYSANNDIQGARNEHDCHNILFELTTNAANTHASKNTRVVSGEQ